MVAAGMFNPFASKSLIKTWLASDVFAYLHQFYPKAEEALKAKFFFQQLIYRPFMTIHEQNSWIAQTADEDVQAFVEATHTKPAYAHQVYDPLGGIVVKKGGYLLTGSFLDAVRQWLIASHSFCAEHFDVMHLTDNEADVNYRGIRAGKVIFCTGVPLHDPMRWLPVIKLKGETLTVGLQDPPELIYNRGVYAVATQTPGAFKVGSTYQLKNIVNGISLGGQQELEMKFRQLFRSGYTILGQDWGLRPTTVDRKPVLGFWPGKENRIIFNGLGTKGVSLAPYFALVLADWLTNSREMMPETNINRFKALYSKV